MFSSNHFPHLLSSTNVLFPSSNSFFDHEKDVEFHNSILSGDYKIHAYNNNHVHPPDSVVNELVMQEQFSEGSGLQYGEHHDDLLDSVISPYKMKMAASKKDGHSKIETARGPRDRRVRLSIEIARKFFCLQDLLGFDKASKTLDWLLGKSLASIKDLVEQTSTTQCSSSTVTEESKVKFLETIENNGKKKKKAASVVVKCVVPKKKKTSVQRCNVQDNVAREQLRTEARARARERTKEKMRVKKLDGWSHQIEQQNDYHQNSSFQINGFHEHLGDHGINDLDLE